MITYMEGLADDAMLNQYEILFPNGIPGGGDANLLKLRADQQFEMPQEMVEEYTIEYQGIKIPKTSSKEGTDKKFTIQFRLDSNWSVYRALYAWKNLVQDGNTGASGTEAQTRVPMLFNHYGPNKQLAYSIRFNDVKLLSLKGGSFDHTSADPARVEAEFIYLSKDNA